MKILALDLGEKWIGTAISDALKITCKPYRTIEISLLENELQRQINNPWRFGIETIDFKYLMSYDKLYNG